eukprot:6033290-Pleurochrysis_carterae.AAC.2
MNKLLGPPAARLGTTESHTFRNRQPSTSDHFSRSCSKKRKKRCAIGCLRSVARGFQSKIKGSQFRAFCKKYWALGAWRGS